MNNHDVYEMLSDLDDKARANFRSFMAGVSEYEELVRAGFQFLSAYRTELKRFQRPPLPEMSSVAAKLIEAHIDKTEWMRSYVRAGCRHQYVDMQIINKLCICEQGLHQHIGKAKTVLNGLKPLVEEGCAMMVKENNALNCCIGKLSAPPEEDESTADGQSEASEFAMTMQTIYNMLEIDYSMQEKIVSCLKLTTSLEQLESYCLMWDLQPFVDQDVMNVGWRLVS